MVYLWIISVNLVFVKYVNTEKSIKLLQLFNNTAAVLIVLSCCLQCLFDFFKAISYISKCSKRSVFK